MSPINGGSGHGSACGHDTTLILDSVNNYHHQHQHSNNHQQPLQQQHHHHHLHHSNHLSHQNHHQQHQQQSHYHSHYQQFEFDNHHIRIDHFGTQLKISSGPKRDKQSVHPTLTPVRFLSDDSQSYLLQNDLADLGISLAKLALHAEGAPIIVCEEDILLTNVKTKFTPLKNRRKSYRLLPSSGYLMPDIETFPGLMNSSLSNAYHRFQQNSVFLSHQHGSMLSGNGAGQDLGHKHMNVQAQSLNALAFQHQQQAAHQVTIQQQFAAQVFHEDWSTPAGVNGHHTKLSSGVALGNGGVGVTNGTSLDGVGTNAIDTTVDIGQDETCSLGSCLDDAASSFSSISASSSSSYSSSPPSSSVSLILEQFHKESTQDCFNMLHCDRQHPQHHRREEQPHVIASEASTSSGHLLCITDDDGVQFSSNSSSSSAVSPSSMSHSSLSSSSNCASPFRKSSLCSSSISSPSSSLSLSSVSNLSNNFCHTTTSSSSILANISTMTASFMSNSDVNSIDHASVQQSLKCKKLSRTIRARKRKKTSPPPPPIHCGSDVDTPTEVVDNWSKSPPVKPPARPWIPLAKPSELPVANVFTVMCYNVLCEKYATRQLYGYCPNWAMLWEYRRKTIMSEIKNFDSDIISLQEVETDQFYNFFQENLKDAGYEGIFSPKSRAKTMGENERKHVDGCAIFFKSSKFRLLNQTLIEFNQLAMNNADGSENMLNRVMPKDNIALIALLETKEPETDDLSTEPKLSAGHPLIVCTAHIHWDPEFCDVKLIQTMMLMNELRRFSAEAAQKFRLVPPGQKPDQNSVPLILCGDLNSLPDSGVVEYLTNGRISVEHSDFKKLSYNDCLKKISTFTEKHSDYYSHGFNLMKAYKDGVLPFTNYTFDFKGVIDYIFCSRDTLSVLGVLGPLEERWLDENKVVGCPHPYIPSDHFPLVVELEMIPKYFTGMGSGAGNGGGSGNGSNTNATTNGHRR